MLAPSGPHNKLDACQRLERVMAMVVVAMVTAAAAAVRTLMRGETRNAPRNVRRFFFNLKCQARDIDII